MLAFLCVYVCVWVCVCVCVYVCVCVWVGVCWRESEREKKRSKRNELQLKDLSVWLVSSLNSTWNVYIYKKEKKKKESAVFDLSLHADRPPSCIFFHCFIPLPFPPLTNLYKLIYWIIDLPITSFITSIVHLLPLIVKTCISFGQKSQVSVN